jgi:hypothetical protein
VDQILTGASNLINPGQPSMSVFQYGGYQAALGLGASDGTAQIVGAFTPAVLSLGFLGWGTLAGRVVLYRGTTYFDALEVVSDQTISRSRLLFFQSGKAYDFGLGVYMSRSRAVAAQFAEWLSHLGGGPGVLRIEISRFRWWILRWRYGALDNVAMSRLPGQLQSFVPLDALDYFNRYARFFLSGG